MLDRLREAEVLAGLLEWLLAAYGPESPLRLASVVQRNTEKYD